MSDPLVVAVLGAASVASFALALWLPGYERGRRVDRRLRTFITAAAADDAETRRARAAADRRAQRSRLERHLEGRIERAKVDLSVGELALTMLVFASGVTALAFALPGTVNPLLALVAAPLGALIPLQWLRLRAARIQRRFRDQLPDTVVLLANALSAGLSFPQAMLQIARDASEPTRGAFEVVSRELALGAAQDQALERLAQRHPSEELELVVAAVNVHQQIGGNLPKILDTIAATLRERSRIAGDVAVLTAQARYSSYVLAGLPVIVAIGLFLVSPDYIGAMLEFEPTRYALGVAVALVIAGFVLMQKMSAVDV